MLFHGQDPTTRRPFIELAFSIVVEGFFWLGTPRWIRESSSHPLHRTTWPVSAAKCPRSSLATPRCAALFVCLRLRSLIVGQVRPRSNHDLSMSDQSAG